MEHQGLCFTITRNRVMSISSPFEMEVHEHLKCKRAGHQSMAREVTLFWKTATIVYQDLRNIWRLYKWLNTCQSCSHCSSSMCKWRIESHNLQQQIGAHSWKVPEINVLSQCFPRTQRSWEEDPGKSKPRWIAFFFLNRPVILDHSWPIEHKTCTLW